MPKKKPYIICKGFFEEISIILEFYSAVGCSSGVTSGVTSLVSASS